MMEVERRLEEIADLAFHHESRFERFGPANFWVRFIIFLSDFSLYLLRRSLSAGRRAQAATSHLLHLHDALAIERSDIVDFITETARELERMPCSLSAMPWADEKLPAEIDGVPIMIETDAMRYYTWLGRTVDAAGAVIELGAWMGGSTICLAAGLRQNSRCRDVKLHVFDAFVWRQWMVQFGNDPTLAARYKDGDDFMGAFNRNCAAFGDMLDVTKCNVSFQNQIADLPATRWDGGPISVMVIDHSDSYDANMAAWNVFSPSFVPGKTIVIFNQYGNLRAEELRRFCRDHEDQLEPLHQLACSGRSFTFVGNS